MWRVLGTGEAYTGFRWGNLRERDNFEKPTRKWRIRVRWIFRKCDVGTRNGLNWLRIGTVGGLL